MTFFSPQSLLRHTGGRFLRRPADDADAPTPEGVSTDTRTIQRGQIFFALRGENFNGHDYLQTAARAGSPLLVIDQPDALESVNDTPASVLLVDDVLKAMGRLAAAYRQTFAARVIGVTGSVGKTTTKQIIHAVLAPHFRGSVSPKSFNNAIGVPWTLLNAKPTDAYVVVEIGTNAPGEIAALARIAQPDMAIITAIACAHLEGLGDVGAIIREKASLFDHVPQDGVCIVNGDHNTLLDCVEHAPNLVTFGRFPDSDLTLSDVQRVEKGIAFQVNDQRTFKLPMLGAHNAFNALPAIAVGRQMGLNDRQIAAGLAKAQSPPMRLTLQHLGKGVTLINDAYNANPESMTGALLTLRDYPAPARRVAILGDMLELGDTSADLHLQLIEEAEYLVSTIILIGPRMAAADSRGAAAHTIDNWSDQTPDRVAAWLRPRDTVLLKASRGMKLERLIPAFEKRFGPAKRHRRVFSLLSSWYKSGR